MFLLGGGTQLLHSPLQKVEKIFVASIELIGVTSYVLGSRCWWTTRRAFTTTTSSATTAVAVASRSSNAAVPTWLEFFQSCSVALESQVVDLRFWSAVVVFVDDDEAVEEELVVCFHLFKSVGRSFVRSFGQLDGLDTDENGQTKKSRPKIKADRGGKKERRKKERT